MADTSTPKAPIIAVSRHRIATDGKGVTTLVGFHGCPLRCRYCLNPFSFKEDTPKRMMTPEELYKEIGIDILYFLATGGGVTFGGGEPLLYPEFIAEFARIAAASRSAFQSGFNICLETSLNVPFSNIERVLPFVNTFIVDIKSFDEDIYRSYTSKSGEEARLNLSRLVSMGYSDKLHIRIPLIPGFNDREDTERTERALDDMGIKRREVFKYVIKEK